MAEGSNVGSARRRLDFLLVQGETRVFQNRDGIIIGHHQPHFYPPPGKMRERSLFAESRIERIGIVLVREHIVQGDLCHTVQLPFSGFVSAGSAIIPATTKATMYSRARASAAAE